ncbi:SLATT domain-containing protein [Moritella sp. Urea-trap-13]|uniref:SLATT domain-containing protein n=1 Tax=Moritella sp. Urea-trap-13 TaxID=2058327 RepID=UPI0012FEA842|nr:SLATT domain-containing protein [Moritella sp. Urea-trap-13]
MSEQTIKKQIAREFYNVIYGAKLNFSSFDICEKLPSIISLLSLSIGVFGLGFKAFNSTALSVFLLIVGIIGIMLKPRELQKEAYCEVGVKLTGISKKLELLHSNVNEADEESVIKTRADLSQLQDQHLAISQPAPVFLSSWFAHYKVFSEHNNKWMCEELNLGIKDKIPLSLRLPIIGLFIVGLIYLNPFCFFSKTWVWVTEPCPAGCFVEEKAPADLKPLALPKKLSGASD